MQVCTVLSPGVHYYYIILRRLNIIIFADFYLVLIAIS